MYSSDALSRSRYRERRLNNNVLNKNSAFSVEQVTAAPMADTICVPLFSVTVTLNFDLLTSKPFCQLLLTWTTSSLSLNVL